MKASARAEVERCTLLAIGADGGGSRPFAELSALLARSTTFRR